MKDIVIIGAGGFGREVASLIEDINQKHCKWNLRGFIDEDINKKGDLINGYKVLGGISYLENKKDMYFVIAIGNPQVKENLLKKITNKEIEAATLIHPSCIIGKENKIGKGVIICAGNIITVNTKIESFVTINLACTIGHDSTIEKYTTLYPNVNISGNCKVEELSELGSKTVVIQGMKIGSKTVTGAGTVIINDISGECTVVGVPGKIKKKSLYIGEK